MTKTIMLRSELTDEVVDGQSIITLVTTPDDIRDLCLGLCLLRDGLVSEILLRSRKDFAMCLEQKSDYEENRLVRSHGFVAIQLTATELERLVDFFLRYYRDGVVEVDHIDIEANENVPGRMDAYVTIFVQDYRPSVSAEEAKRKLGVG